MRSLRARLPVDTRVDLGPVSLRSPLIGASGTVGSVVDFAGAAAFEVYGAAVAKSVSQEPWEGRPAPRIAPAGDGMLNGIGIQNPGVTAWADSVGPKLSEAACPVWGSAVGESPNDFAQVARGLEAAGVASVEVNLSCPNLDGGGMFALDARASAKVISAVSDAVSIPIGAKLSPNAVDIVEIAAACMTAGADWLVLTNTVWGTKIDLESRKPVLSGGVGGYSGAALKPISMRCVWQVHQALPDVPIVGCGGVRCGEDVIEYLLAGASAVAIGTAHFAEPKVGRRIHSEMTRFASEHGVGGVRDLTGLGEAW